MIEKAMPRTGTEESSGKQVNRGKTWLWAHKTQKCLSIRAIQVYSTENNTKHQVGCAGTLSSKAGDEVSRLGLYG